MIKNYIFRYSLLLIISCSFFVSATAGSARQPTDLPSVDKKLAALEASSGGRIGVFVINTANNTSLEYRAKEYFPLQSTSKVIGVAAILKKSMSDRNLLQQKNYLYKTRLG